MIGAHDNLKGLTATEELCDFIIYLLVSIYNRKMDFIALLLLVPSTQNDTLFSKLKYIHMEFCYCLSLGKFGIGMVGPSATSTQIDG